MADGKISVELRLELDAMRRQLALAKDDIRKAMSGTVASGSAGKPKAATDQDKVHESVKKTTKAVNEQLEAWRKLHAGGIAPGMKITDASRSTGAGGQQPGGVLPVGGYGLATRPQIGAGSKYTGPIPPVIPISVPANSLQGMFSKLITAPLSKPLQMVTQATAALAALRVALGLASYALRLMMIPVRLLTGLLMSAIQRASSFYSGSLRSGGLPLSFTIQRSAIARALGVGENEVLQYGKQFAILNEKFRFSSQIFAQTTPVLTSTGWEVKALQADFEALKSEIASSFAPIVRDTVSVLRKSLEGLKPVLAIITEQFAKLDIVLRSMVVFKMLSEGNVKAAMGALYGAGSAPQPTASANRLPASPWEKMGLVIGQGPGSNYAAQTARNTGTLVKLFERVQGAIPRGENTLKNPAYAQP